MKKGFLQAKAEGSIILLVRPMDDPGGTTIPNAGCGPSGMGIAHDFRAAGGP